MRTAGCLLLLLAATAGAQTPPPLPNVGPPLMLRLEGSFAPTHAGARGAGFTVVSLGFLDGRPADRFLGVERARTVGGDQPLDGKDVLALVAPFEPNLLVAGPADVVHRLRTLPAGTSVQIEGLVERGSRTYYLREVRAADVP
jgi:hypothetical protein